ncbi:MAG: hypothetical protein LBG79_06205 [Spirochaetaceae bacterium]|jgi:hypothetical protein|nr:hypothetical protein [Spirochaetaceae bacterium]
MNKAPLLVLILVFSLNTALEAQTSSSTTTTTTEKPYEFPQWAKDVRRFDVIAFGVFPFAWLFSSIGLDLYRSAQHEWSDNRYYPWPVTGKNPVLWNNDEYIMAFVFAGLVSLTVAIADFVIIMIKRSAAAKRARMLTPDAPVIKRTPMQTDSVTEDSS